MISLRATVRLLSATAIVASLAACASEPAPTAVHQDAQSALTVRAPLLPSQVAALAVAATPVASPTKASGMHGQFEALTSGTSTYAFTVDPTKSQAFIFGVHMVSFPANTICDPTRSSYGAGTWLQPCEKATLPLTITATTWTDAQGRARIDFSTDLRFVPNANGALPAIYLRDPSASLSDYSRIDYCASGGTCVNEAVNDAALRTQREAVTGYLFRIIRHFSGYNVWA